MLPEVLLSVPRGTVLKIARAAEVRAGATEKAVLEEIRVLVRADVPKAEDLKTARETETREIVSQRADQEEARDPARADQEEARAPVRAGVP
mgnify:CR=1 FL=1